MLESPVHEAIDKAQHAVLAFKAGYIPAEMVEEAMRKMNEMLGLPQPIPEKPKTARPTPLTVWINGNADQRRNRRSKKSR